MSAVPAFSLHATPESVARWRIGRDGVASPPPKEGDPLPLSYLVFLRVQPILGVAIHHLLDRDPDRGLYGGVGYRAEGIPRVGERFVAAGKVISRREVATPRGTLVLRTLETGYRDAGGAVVTESVRMVDLPPGPPQPPAAGPRKASAMPKVADIAPLTRNQVAWLTVETGDMNPLHLDSSYAASRLFPDVVVPGTLTAAVLERELCRVLGRALRAFELRLNAASFPGQAFTLHAAPKDGGLAYEMFRGDELMAEGSAA